MGPHHGVPGELIWVYEVVEDLAGVVEADEGRVGGAFDEPAGGVGVVDEASGDHLREELVELAEAVTSEQIGL